MRTIYGPNTCKRCGLPAGIASTSDRLCPSCYRSVSHAMKTIIRPYAQRIKPTISSTCPADALYHYAKAAYQDQGLEVDPYFTRNS